MARAGPSTLTSSSAKPYDRPASYQLKARGKGKSTATASEPAGARATGEVNVGAPAQLGQVSRKGKKAWRKNIDVRDIEKGLEEMREEERLTG